MARGRSRGAPREPEVRINYRIKVPEVRLIDSEGNQLGIVKTSEAIKMAEEQGVDLVEVASNASPPVCRLMDFGKYRYELKKQQAAKKQKVMPIKEIKLGPNIGEHDLNVKVNRIKEFLEAGHKTRVRIFFRGRQIVHPELGKDLAVRITEEVSEIGSVDLEPKLEGKNLIMVLSPNKKS